MGFSRVISWSIFCSNFLYGKRIFVIDLNLSGKSVLITGGSKGIGFSIAEAFANEGAKVALCARDAGALEASCSKIQETGAKAVWVSADLFTSEGCESAVNETVKSFGGLDILINNASTNVGGRLEDLSDEQVMERVIGKTLASMRCCRFSLPFLRASGAGRIVCIGGTSSRTPGPSSLPSGLGNSSLSNFVKHFSNDIAADGITVNVVHPPFTKTDRYPARLAARAKQLGVSIEEAEASFTSEFPIGRIIEPKDIAPLVLFLASINASAITGQAVAVDGGATPYVSY